MREYSVPAVSTESALNNLAQPIWDNAETAPHAMAVRLTDGDTIRDVSAQQLRDEVTAAAKGLIAHGLQPGQRVAILSRTRYEWTLLDYAIWATGAVTVPIYPTSSAEQTRWILNDSAAVVCIVEEPDQLTMLRRLLPELAHLRRVWFIEGGGQNEVIKAPNIDATIAPLAELTQAGSEVADAEVLRRRTALELDDLATIIYTSGTTGLPKGCRVLHRNFVFGISNGMTLLTNEFSRQSSTLLYLPLAHVLAREIQCGAIMTGTTISYTPDTCNLLDDLQRFKPTTLLAIPRVLERLFNGAQQKATAAKKGRIFEAAVDTAIAYSAARDSGKVSLGLRLRHSAFDVLVYRKLRAALGGRCTATISG
ncbi:MAG: AMP-dependent synthetase/ligase, partial [Pseudonocardiaceae bacterium]